MAELKTQPTDASVEAFLDSIADEKRRLDCRVVLDLMREVTGEEPKMWGSSIVGFGSYHYKYASGHEGDSLRTGFSPRKEALTLYLSSGLQRVAPLLPQLGKHKTGKGCLYVKRIEDIDLDVLREMIKQSLRQPMGGIDT